MRYEALTAEQERPQLVTSGLDEATADLFSQSYANIREGAFSFANGDLTALIIHATEPLSVTLRSWL